MPGCDDWFLTAAERDNPATLLDQGGEAWSDGNLAVPLVHGACYFERLHQVLSGTQRGDVVLFTDWRGDPDEHLWAGEDVGHVLSALASRGVEVRGLVWRSHPDETSFSEQENRSLSDLVNAAGGDVRLDERVRRAGSHHQKMFVVLHPSAPERDVAFVGGIDLCHGRNDSCAHLGDPQTVALDERYGPTPAWHDIQMELHGPSVHDLVTTFLERWNDPTPLQRWPSTLRRGHRPHHHEAIDVARGDPVPAGPHAVQVLRTYPMKRPVYPFAPRGERSIALAYQKAFARARRLIYVEDQYLWSRDVAATLASALRAAPELRVVAVVPRLPDQDGRFTGPPNRIGQLDALRILHDAGGDRVAVYDIARGDVPIYVHAKVCIVDDVWMTIGSDNLNRRSWTHDSELSCAVLDATLDDREPTDPAGLGDGARRLPRDLRLSLWAEHTACASVPVDPLEGFELLRRSADAWDEWESAGRRGAMPAGRLRHHRPQPVARALRPLVGAAYRLVNDPDGRPLAMRARGTY